MEISPIQMRVNEPENDSADLLTPTINHRGQFIVRKRSNILRNEPRR
jgi:hypothetical protein